MDLYALTCEIFNNCIALQYCDTKYKEEDKLVLSKLRFMNLDELRLFVCRVCAKSLEHGQNHTLVHLLNLFEKTFNAHRFAIYELNKLLDLNHKLEIENTRLKLTLSNSC